MSILLRSTFGRRYFTQVELLFGVPSNGALRKAPGYQDAWALGGHARLGLTLLTLLTLITGDLFPL